MANGAGNIAAGFFQGLNQTVTPVIRSLANAHLEARMKQEQLKEQEKRSFETFKTIMGITGAVGLDDFVGEDADAVLNAPQFQQAEGSEQIGPSAVAGAVESAQTLAGDVPARPVTPVGTGPVAAEGPVGATAPARGTTPVAPEIPRSTASTASRASSQPATRFHTEGERVQMDLEKRTPLQRIQDRGGSVTLAFPLSGMKITFKATTDKAKRRRSLMKVSKLMDSGHTMVEAIALAKLSPDEAADFRKLIGAQVLGSRITGGQDVEKAVMSTLEGVDGDIEAIPERFQRYITNDALLRFEEQKQRQSKELDVEFAPQVAAATERARRRVGAEQPRSIGELTAYIAARDGLEPDAARRQLRTQDARDDAAAKLASQIGNPTDLDSAIVSQVFFESGAVDEEGNVDFSKVKRSQIVTRLKQARKELEAFKAEAKADADAKFPKTLIDFARRESERTGEDPLDILTRIKGEQASATGAGTTFGKTQAERELATDIDPEFLEAEGVTSGAIPTREQKIAARARQQQATLERERAKSKAGELGTREARLETPITRDEQRAKTLVDKGLHAGSPQAEEFLNELEARTQAEVNPTLERLAAMSVKGNEESQRIIEKVAEERQAELDERARREQAFADDQPIAPGDIPTTLNRRTGQPVPSGTTVGEARAIAQPVTVSDKESLEQARAAWRILAEYEDAVDAIYTSENPLINGANVIRHAARASNEFLALLRVKGKLAPIVRFLGDRGKLAVDDIKRGEQAIGLFSLRAARSGIKEGVTELRDIIQKVPKGMSLEDSALNFGEALDAETDIRPGDTFEPVD